MARTYKIRKTTRKPKSRQRGGRKEVEKVIVITATKPRKQDLKNPARKKAGARGIMPARQNGGAFSKADLIKRSNTKIELPYRNVTKPMPSFRTFE